jgi:hypothetical protein
LGGGGWTNGSCIAKFFKEIGCEKVRAIDKGPFTTHPTKKQVEFSRGPNEHGCFEGQATDA